MTTVATIFNFPTRVRRVDVDFLLGVPTSVLDRHLYEIQQTMPECLHLPLAAVQAVADALAPEKPLLPGWSVEGSQVRRAELLSLLALYPCAKGDGKGLPRT
jgi:hypothetical protein